MATPAPVVELAMAQMVEEAERRDRERREEQLKRELQHLR